MVSNSHSNPGQERHRQHRRQISTPSTTETAKMSKLPAQAMQRYHAHRRGQSTDQRSLHARQPSIQDGAIPTTNAAVQPRNFLSKEQVQQLIAQGNLTSQNSNSFSFAPDCQSLSHDDLQEFTNCNVNDGSTMAYIGPNFVALGTQGVEGQPVNVFDKIQQQQHVCNSNSACDNALDHRLLDSSPWDTYQQSNFAEFQSQASGMPRDMRRLSAQSNVSAQSKPPQTPTRSGNTQYHPITPATTPFHKSATVTCEQAHSSPTKDNGLSAFGSSDASDMQRARSLQGVAGATPTQPKIEMPSPPNTASFDFDSNDAFDCKQGSSFENPESHLPQHHYTSSSASLSSFYSSPELADMPSPGDTGGRNPKVPILPATPNRQTPKRLSNATSATSPDKANLSPRPASIDNLNLDARVHASINQTGVTMDEIASFIFGPDPEDGKWVCLHPECGRRFGRKENIKSHVQTHLGDRQFKCEHCGKCFVRGHDLKRHAKIHTGDKPYECLCGNVFARHDALTRHRQRGMCVGGYQGVVRKAVKRGRPKKLRPEMDERQAKSARTRQRVAERSSAESVSGCSDMSRNSPPSETFETTSLRPNSPGFAFTTPNYSLPPDVFTFTPPASPRHNNAAAKESPTQTYRSLTPSTEGATSPMSPSKHRPMLENSGMPFISEDTYQYPDIGTSNSSTANVLSSPHTAPTLTDSTNGSDLDLWINQDIGASFDPDMASFPEYTSSLDDDGMDLFQGKSLASMQPVLNEEVLRYPNDEFPSEVMSRDFFMD